MKLPYIKIYTADLLAAGRNLTAQQLGEAILGVCEQAFENDTAYLPANRREEMFYDMLLQWKNESFEMYSNKKSAGRKGGKRTQHKCRKIDGSKAGVFALNHFPKQTETDTDTDTETETNTETENLNTFTAQPNAAQKAEQSNLAVLQVQKTEYPTEGQRTGQTGHKLLALPAPASGGDKPKTPLQVFSNQVLVHFEPHVTTETQKRIWFKRNCRCLSDILNFCGQDIPLALQTIQVCATRLAKAGLSGGYEAVCRNLPEYYAQAQQDQEVAHAAC